MWGSKGRILLERVICHPPCLENDHLFSTSIFNRDLSMRIKTRLEGCKRASPDEIHSLPVASHEQYPDIPIDSPTQYIQRVTTITWSRDTANMSGSVTDLK
jgi:hypothetical protein